MSYASQDDLITRFGEDEILSLSDHSGSGAIDDDVVAGALADADATINSYVGRRYALPLTSVPDRLVRIACDLTRRYLYAARPTDEVLAIEKRALAWLRDISTGAAVLDVATADQEQGNDVSLVQSSRPLFGGLGRGGW